MSTRQRFRYWFVLIIAVIVPLLVPAARVAADEPVIVPTQSGPVEGVVTDEGQQFLGIPYAAPPVDELRWRPPQPPAPWTEPLDASEFADSCAQPPSPFGTASVREDCLYLNVFTPPRGLFGSFRRDPVMVWIHPGTFQYGEGSAWDPRRMVERGVVVVTINYRLGPFGFLAHPALTAESPDASSGNYGILDQQAALRWVRDNIASFGGNPDRVTVFGESAGGLSVHAHLVSPDSSGLFQRAIAQSGAYTLSPPPLAVVEDHGTAFASAVGCPDQELECLREASVEALLAGPPQSMTGYLPNVDGVVLPQTFLQAFTTGDFNQVPVIEGSTRDEFRLFTALFFDLMGNPVTPETYPAAIAAVLGVPPELVPTIIAQYPLEEYASAALALSAIGTDAVFACNTHAARVLLSQHVPVWGYEFDDPDAPMETLPPVSFPYDSYHGAELPYLFDTGSSLDAAQQALSADMVRYWTQFAWIANPNTLAAPLWIRYGPLLERIQLLTPPEPDSYAGFAEDHQCAFWAQLAGI